MGRGWVRGSCVALLGCCLLWWQTGRAALSIDITQGHVAPLPIALPPLALISMSPGLGTIGHTLNRKLLTVITSDLVHSGLFRPLDPQSFLKKNGPFQQPPRFDQWRVLGAQALLTGSLSIKEDKLMVNLGLWDVLSGQKILAQGYNAELSQWRRVAHMMADSVYERLTGEKGYFDSRVVFISGSGHNKPGRLALMDYDGARLSYLTRGRHPVLTPFFSPDHKKIAYVENRNGRPFVRLLNLDTERTRIIRSSTGILYSPRFTYDGQHMLLTYAQGENSDIYKRTLSTGLMVRLTSDPNIDTSPSPSPDGHSIAFVSDRGGSPQLYTMTMDGTHVRRISFSGGHYFTPAWSPRGDYIAFTKQQNHHFFIGVIHPDGSGERLLVEGDFVATPSWSPNGRVVIFHRGTGSASRLYTVDLTGYNEHPIPTPTDATDPSWSTLLG